jgi:hypothetical protein
MYVCLWTSRVAQYQVSGMRTTTNSVYFVPTICAVLRCSVKVQTIQLVELVEPDRALQKSINDALLGIEPL